MSVRIINGDCRGMLATLPDASVHCVVTSPPYFGLRDYGVDGQIGLEATPEAFVAELVAVFREVRRVLRADGTLWLNLGDSYVNNPSTSAIPRSAQGNGCGAFRIPDDGDMAVRRMTGRANAATPMIQSGLKKKDLVGIPWRVAFALQADGWYLRSDIIWHKPNPMPESITDRPTSAHEHIFLLAKAERYFYDADAIREDESVPDWDDGSRTFGGVNKHGANDKHGERTTGRVAGKRVRGLPPRHAAYPSSDQSGLDVAGRGSGRNSRNVWRIATRPYPEAHFATFPPDLAERCILAGCPTGGTVLDPFGGAGTTGLVADRLGRDAILIELNPAYADMARNRVARDAGMFASVAAE